MPKEDGGPAFPRIWDDDTVEVDSPGMTLRDWFAGMAMQGLIADPKYFSYRERTSMDAYGYADAMIQERKKFQQAEEAVG